MILRSTKHHLLEAALMMTRLAEARDTTHIIPGLSFDPYSGY